MTLYRAAEGCHPLCHRISCPEFEVPLPLHDRPSFPAMVFKALVGSSGEQNEWTRMDRWRNPAPAKGSRVTAPSPPSGIVAPQQRNRVRISAEAISDAKIGDHSGSSCLTAQALKGHLECGRGWELEAWSWQRSRPLTRKLECDGRERLLAYRKRHTPHPLGTVDDMLRRGMRQLGFLPDAAWGRAYVTHLKVWVRVVLSLHTVISSTTCPKICKARYVSDGGSVRNAVAMGMKHE